MELRVMKQCKIIFFISATFIDEVEANDIPLDVHEVILGSIYLYVSDKVFKRRANQQKIVKYGKYYVVNAHNNKSKL
jgi:hypothetical protein